jgi:ABC-type lipoprotein release transport system permease subunit
VLSLYNSFNPELKITASEGKVYTLTEDQLRRIRQVQGIELVSETVEENALARFGEMQYIVMMKGVDENFVKMTPLDDFLLNGRYAVGDETKPYATIGAGVAYYLGIYPQDFAVPMSLYVPKRTKKTLSGMPDQTFNNDRVNVAGVFAIQQEFDVSYVLVPIGLARNLLEYDREISALEIKLAPGASVSKAREGLIDILGPGFEIKDRYQQQATLYKVMRSEKWAVFFILTFILIIAAFNMIGSLSMLIIDKKKDIAVLWSLGADKNLIRKIFFTEGMMISLSGGLLGLLLGGLIALLQQEFGILKLGGGEGTYIVDAYPVKVQLMDFFSVLATVLLIGVLTTWYPVRQISRRYLSQRLNFFLMR